LKERDRVIKRLATLTPREREVFSRLVAGHANEVIASDLRLSKRTVELYRARIMEKTGSRSLAQLVRLAMEVEAVPLSAQRPAAT
jgi:two-component system, LuxR family, response regulator FixJ